MEDADGCLNRLGARGGSGGQICRGRGDGSAGSEMRGEGRRRRGPSRGDGWVLMVAMRAAGHVIEVVVGRGGGG